MKNIIVTGGCGFIGLHLVNRLLQNPFNFIYILDDLSVGEFDESMRDLFRKYPNRVKFIHCDLTKPIEIRLFPKIDELYHLAGRIATKQINTSPIDVLYDNIRMMSSVINFCNEKQVGKMLFTSTIENISATPLKYRKRMVDEKSMTAFADPKDPRWTYAFTKTICEVMLYHSGVNHVVSKFTNVYGPRMCQDYVIKTLIKKFKTQSVVDVYNPRDTREFMYVTDAVDGIVRLMAHLDVCKKGETFIFGGSQIYTIKELSVKIRKMLDSKSKINYIGNSKDLRASSYSKARKILGWEPLVDLEEGLVYTINYYA